MAKLRLLGWVINLIAVIFVAGGLACKTGLAPETAYERIRSYVDTISVIDTHEHQIPAATQGNDSVNFYTLLSKSYLQADLVSAGAPSIRSLDIENYTLDELWATYGQALDSCRTTSYYSHFLAGFRIYSNCGFLNRLWAEAIDRICNIFI